MNAFEKTMCGYAEMGLVTHSDHMPIGWEWRSIVDIAYRINKLLHPGYGEPFSPWAFFRSDGKQMDYEYTCCTAATGYLIFNLGERHYACFELKFDPYFGFHYVLRSCSDPVYQICFQ